MREAANILYKCGNNFLSFFLFCFTSLIKMDDVYGGRRLLVSYTKHNNNIIIIYIALFL